MDRSYFDHNATTPVSREVLDASLPVLLEVYGNASSIHRDGQAARRKLDEARARIASLLGCTPKEIVITSGGTEADNLAILGASRGGHVITSSIEHPAVLSACAQLPDVTYIPPSRDGVIDPKDVRAAIRPETTLISIMHVNNETGAVQPVREIARIAREAGVLMHSDGVQAAGRMPIADLGADLYSISAHKMYAPKGAGALYVRKGVELKAQMHGGRHESGRRAGTENVFGAAALGAACEWMREHGAAESARLAILRDRLEHKVLNTVADVRVNAASAPRAANTANFCIPGIEGEAMVIALDLRGFAVSSGSACSSGAVEPSHVLMAMGLTKEEARSSIRISLGRSNTEAQVDALADAIAACAAHLRRLSPAYA